MSVDSTNPYAVFAELRPVDTWKPSAALCPWLWFGAMAVLLDGLLRGVGNVADLADRDQTGFTWSLGLNLAAFVPQLVLVMALVKLAREADSVALRRSCIGCWGVSWLFYWLNLVDPEILPRAGMLWVELGFVAGAAALAYAVLKRPPGHAKPAGDGNKSSGCAVAAGIAALILAKVVLKGLAVAGRRNRMFAQLDLETVVALEMMVLLLFLIIFTLWLAVSKIRLRHKLGTACALWGAFDLLLIVVYLAIFIGVGRDLVVVFNAPGANDAMIEAVFSDWHATFAGVGLAECLVSSVLAAAVLLSARAAALDVPFWSDPQMKPT